MGVFNRQLSMHFKRLSTSFGIAVNHAAVKALCQATYRAVSTNGRTSSHRRSYSFVVPSVAAACVVGLSSLGIYCAIRTRSLERDLLDDVFETPFINGKSVSIIYQFKSFWFPKELFPKIRTFQKIQDFTVRENDILVVSFPKSGNVLFLVCHVDSQPCID
jgi:hypothetical protein